MYNIEKEESLRSWEWNFLWGAFGLTSMWRWHSFVNKSVCCDHLFVGWRLYESEECIKNQCSEFQFDQFNSGQE